MKRITFTFLSCIMLAALLTAESIAAVRMNLSPDLSTPRHYTGVMQDLVSKNRERRKAFNKHEETKANTSEIEKILKNKTLVSSRPASDAEKNDILSMLIATTITSPNTLSNRMTEDLNAAQSSNNPLDRHCYIVDMTEIFAHELISQGKIESNFETFQAFSGVDKDRFLKLFYQVKRSHRPAFAIQKKIKRFKQQNQNQKDKPYLPYSLTWGNMHPSKSVEIRKIAAHALIDMAKNEDFQLSHDAKKGLLYFLIIEKDPYIFNEIRNFFIENIRENYDHSSNLARIFLKEIEENTVQSSISMKALDFLINTANESATHDIPTFGDADATAILGEIACTAKDQEISSKALTALIEASNRSNTALEALYKIAYTAENQEIQSKALKLLVEGAKDHKNPNHKQIIQFFAYCSFVGKKSVKIAPEAKKTLNFIAQDRNHPAHEYAANCLKYIGNSDVKNISIEAVNFLDRLAYEGVLPLEQYACQKLYDIAISAEARSLEIGERALDYLIKIINTINHPLRHTTFKKLRIAVSTAETPTIRHKAMQALIEIAHNITNSLQYEALKELSIIANNELGMQALHAVNSLIRIANDNNNPLQHDSLKELSIIAIKGNGQSIVQKATETLINIANDSNHQLQTQGLFLLADVAIKGKNEVARNEALKALIAITRNNDHSLQAKSLSMLKNIVIKRKNHDAWSELARVAKSDTHKLQSDAFSLLKDITIEGNDEGIQKEAWQIISEIGANNTHSLQVAALAHKIAISKDAGIRKDALRHLIKIKNNKKDPQHNDALFKLMEIAFFENGTEIGDAAQESLNLNSKFREETSKLQVRGQKLREESIRLSSQLSKINKSSWKQIEKLNRMHNPIEKIK